MKISILLRMFFLMLIICCSCANNILHIHKESEGLIGIELRDGRIGFKDKQGKLVIPFKFHKVGPAWDNEDKYNIEIKFKNGIVPVRNKDGLCGTIDKNGNWQLQPIYKLVSPFNDEGISRAFLEINKIVQLIYINSQGDIIYGPFNESLYSDFYFYEDEKYALFKDKTSEKWGIFNHKGQITVKPIYDDIDNISEGRAYAQINNKYKLIDMNGNVILDLQGGHGRHFINGTSIVRKGINGKAAYAIIDNQGNFLFPFRDDIEIQYVTPCETQFLPLEISDCPLYMFHPVIDGVVDAMSTKNNLYGLLNTKGEWVVEPIYESLHYEKDKLYYFMTKDKKKGLMNTKGEIVEWYK